MGTINKWFEMDLTQEELSKESSLYLYGTKVNAEKILKWLKITLFQEKEISVDSLSVYRLESLIRVITIKKIIFERLKKNSKAKGKICELETQIKKYMEDAISIINEIITSGQIN